MHATHLGGLCCIWAAHHHAEVVRDEEEVGDRYGVAVRLEHTLFINQICIAHLHTNGTCIACGIHNLCERVHPTVCTQTDSASKRACCQHSGRTAPETS